MVQRTGVDRTGTGLLTVIRADDAREATDRAAGRAHSALRRSTMRSDADRVLAGGDHGPRAPMLLSANDSAPSGDGGAAMQVVRRRFVDGAEDWSTATTRKNKLGRTVTRSQALAAVDRALEAWTGRGGATRDQQKVLLSAIKKAITGWRATKKGGSIRDAEVDVLDQEVDAELAEIQQEEDDAQRLEAERREEQRQKEIARTAKRNRRSARKRAAAKKAAKAQETARKQQEAGAQFKPWSEMAALTLQQLAEYMKATPQWHTRSTLSDGEREIARKLQPFGSSASTRGFLVKDVAALGVGAALDDVVAALSAYSLAVESNDPFALEKASTAATAVSFGRDLVTLTAAFPSWVLKTAMKDEDFRLLVKHKLVDGLVDYYTKSTQRPIFQAENGSDFRSYAIMRVNDKKDPRDYETTVLGGRIRNFHRFEKAALDQLIVNYSDTSKAKPLTIVLHAAVDHNGAFHRDPLLTAVITNPHINALLIEGGETLSSYQSQITPLATAYGKNDRIDQVMFAGHGNSRLIQMAGTVVEGTGERAGKLSEVDDAIDLEHNLDQANALFDEVLKNMDPKVQDSVTGPGSVKQSNRRILFNACLTNSNAVPAAMYSGKEAAKKEILEYIEKNASLASYLQQRAEKAGRDVTSLGANASIGSVDLIEPSTGKLDLVSKSDPRVTAPKLIYAEEGIEPGGVLRAALEAWANDETATIEAMKRRAARGSDKWSDAIIEGLYTAILDQEGHEHIATIIQVSEQIAEPLSQLTHDAHCRPRALTDLIDLPDFMRETLFHRLATTTTWKKSRQVRLVVAGVMAVIERGQSTRTTLVNELASNQWDAKSVTDYLDIEDLADEGLLHQIFRSPAPLEAKLLLALVGVLDHQSQQDCKEFLHSRIQKGAPEVPGLPKVDAVPPVARQKGPRAAIPKVPEAPGRKAYAQIPGHRKATPMVPDLPELPALPKVTGNSDVPGRPGRPPRDEVPKIPAVDPFFLPSLGVERLLASRRTEAQLIALVS